jgi:hypothetical protein
MDSAPLLGLVIISPKPRQYACVRTNAYGFSGVGEGLGVKMFDHPATKFYCRRCRKEAGYDPDVCWYCLEPLCEECWDKYGHCGHPEAEAINEKARQVNQPKEGTE